MNEIIRISIISFILGIMIGGVLILLIIGVKMKAIALYILYSVLFHYLEFVLTGIYQQQFSADDFLLDNGREYPLFILSSILEYFIEYYYYDFGKANQLFILVGASMMLFGQAIRSCAMICCGDQFCHLLSRSRSSLKLIKCGIYGYCRHPSYLGFYMWALGSQILLSNPLNFFIFTVVLYKFFSQRILIEDKELAQLFKTEFVEYKNAISSGIPGIE